jgi:hypothetical protein
VLGRRRRSSGNQTERPSLKMYRCICRGCKNLVTVKHFTCLECFLYCDFDVNKLSPGHRMRVRIRRGR